MPLAIGSCPIRISGCPADPRLSYGHAAGLGLGSAHTKVTERTQFKQLTPLFAAQMRQSHATDRSQIWSVERRFHLALCQKPDHTRCIEKKHHLLTTTCRVLAGLPEPNKLDCPASMKPE